MNALRQRLPRLAALVLLVWLFATGAAFAHACQSTIDLDCEECCVEMKAPSAFSTERAETPPATATALPLPPLAEVLHAAWEPAAEPALHPADPPRRGGGDAIPIAFLRLAL